MRHYYLVEFKLLGRNFKLEIISDYAKALLRFFDCCVDNRRFEYADRTLGKLSEILPSDCPLLTKASLKLSKAKKHHA